MGWQESFDAARRARDAGDVAASVTAFARAVAEAEKLGEGDGRLSRTLSEFAELQESLGRFDEAAILWCRAIQLEPEPARALGWCRRGVAAAEKPGADVDLLDDLLRAQLERQQEVLGREHADVAETMLRIAERRGADPRHLEDAKALAAEAVKVLDASGAKRSALTEARKRVRALGGVAPRRKLVARATLESILAAPDDDAPRLVHADVLMEAGDPQGELIAVQCELARLPPEAWERRKELELREHVLLERHGRAIRGALERWSQKVVFRRGFPDSIELTAARFASDGEKILAAAPTLTQVAFLRAKSGLDALVGCAHLGKLSGLSLASGKLTFRAMQRLLETPAVRGLRRLDLSGNRVGPGGARVLAQAPFPRLEELSLAECDLDTEAFGHLARATLPALRALDVSRNFAAPEGLEALLRAKGIRPPERLQLAGGFVTDAQAAVFRASPLLRAAEYLRIEGGRAGAAIVAALEACAPKLVELDLWGNPVGDEGAVAVARLPGLRAADLGNARIGDAGAKALAAAPGPLALLELDGNPIGTAGQLALSRRFRLVEDGVWVAKR